MNSFAGKFFPLGFHGPDGVEDEVDLVDMAVVHTHVFR